ncbi:MAG: DUF503 domain-containing protein [Deltaproteobacteria bacterium]|jgi:uncharacterized protein YlxP (DUF503 family)|nr:DUF503 domain-containing protein [Deltaproteobacteria bacterium]
MFYVGVLEVLLEMEWNQSLKGKRKIVKSILGKVKARFNTSVSEVGLNDNLRWARVGFTMGGPDAKLLDTSLERLLTFVEDNAGALVYESIKDVQIFGEED